METTTRVVTTLIFEEVEVENLIYTLSAYERTEAFRSLQKPKQDVVYRLLNQLRETCTTQPMNDAKAS